MAKGQEERLRRRAAELAEAREAYRRAAQDALEQLDWCIGYLYGSRQRTFAKALCDNRRFIRDAYLRQAR